MLILTDYVIYFRFCHRFYTKLLTFCWFSTAKNCDILIYRSKFCVCFLAQNYFDGEVNEAVVKNLIKNKVFVAVFLGSVAALSAIIVVVFMIIQNNNQALPKEASFLGISLAGMKVEEVEKVVDEKINPLYENFNINLAFKDKSLNINAGECDFGYVGKEVFEAARQTDFKNGESANPDVHYDKSKLDEKISQFAQNSLVAPVKSSYKRVGDSLLVSAGCLGEKINEQLTESEVVSLAKEMSAQIINPQSEPVSGDDIEINLEKIKNEVSCAPKDAKFSISASGKAQYENEADGIDFDLEEAKRIITDPKSGTYKIPLKITKPQVTVALLKAQHSNADCPDVIGTYTSNFSAAEVNRTHNLRLACAAINDKTLAPGEVFSALETIGPGNRSQGYKDAIVFTPNGQTQGTGGGICQVTSTLYIAAVYANMDIVERHNHSYTVIYAPVGQDAAFDSGGVDLKFKNTRQTPVKIKASMTNNS